MFVLGYRLLIDRVVDSVLVRINSVPENHLAGTVSDYHLKWAYARFASAIRCNSSLRLTAAPVLLAASNSSVNSFRAIGLASA